MNSSLPAMPGPGRGDRAVERLLAELVPLEQLVGGRADDEHARHVGEAARVAVAREEVEADRLVGRDRAGAHVVADGRLRAVRDDELVREGAVGGERLLDRELDPLAGELLAVEHQAAVLALGAARSSSRAASIAASAARWARRIPASSASFFTRRRRTKCSRSAVTSIPFARRWSATSQREGRGHDGLLDAEAPGGAQGHLELDLRAREPLRVELVDPELLVGQRVQIRRHLGEAVELEGARGRRDCSPSRSA